MLASLWVCRDWGWWAIPASLLLPLGDLGGRLVPSTLALELKSQPWGPAREGSTSPFEPTTESLCPGTGSLSAGTGLPVE